MMDNKTLLNTSQRRERIIQQLQSQGSVQVTELAAQFHVSAVTIRNDLAFLEKQGIATRAYGGALLYDPTAASPERTIADKSALNAGVKQRIGKLAATLVASDSRVILDSGTTTQQIARQLGQHQGLIVMTNGLNIANALVDAEGVELFLTGGQLRRKSLSFYGLQAEQALANYHFDMLFLGVDGFDLERGVSTHHEAEARLNRCMCEVAERVVVVTDSSKFRRVSLHKILDTRGIDTLVTDDAIPAEYLDGLRQAGVNVMLVSA
ncbi:DeoR family transcriptional regulator [Xenophilus sp. AP218F]|nr:DeoR family transcriptional regulator [Chromobacterium sp. ASV5]OWY40349.1 DeoR family transcriptional regulator [Xenophilus sp. AP218F]